MDANIFTAITTTILAIAAILAYLVQRARYLREIEPDLDLEWPTSIKVGKLGSTLKEPWSFFIDIEVENISKNHAEDLRYDLNLYIFPDHTKSKSIRGKFLDLYRFQRHEILAGRKYPILVYASPGLSKGLQEKIDSWGSPINVEDVGFIAVVTMSYFSRQELLLWFLGKRGRVEYTREISGMWRFKFNEKTKSYDSTPWYAEDMESSIDKAIGKVRRGEAPSKQPPSPSPV